MNVLEFFSLLGLGLFVGVMSGFFGIGGGAFLVPALVRLAGLAWDQAIALSLTQMVPMAALGGWQRFRAGEAHLKLAVISLAGSIPGAWVGRQIVGWLGDWGNVNIGGVGLDPLDTVLTLVFCIFLLYMTLRMWQQREKDGDQKVAGEDSQSHKEDAFNREEVPSREVGESHREEVLSRGFDFPLFEGWLLGLAVGLASSLLGIGGGFLFGPIAVQRFGFPVLLAVGTSLVQIPVTAAVGAALYSTTEGVPYLWLVPVLAGSLTGVQLGVRFSRRFDNRQLKFILGAMLVVVAVMLFGSWVAGLGGGR